MVLTRRRRMRIAGIAFGIGFAIVGMIWGFLGGLGGRSVGRPPRPALQDRLIQPVSDSLRAAQQEANLESGALASEESQSDSQLQADTKSSVDLQLPWGRFRGPNGTGIIEDAAIPQTWSELSNLKWSIELPGAGSSSPILTDKLVFVTCYTGIDGSGSLSNLKRQLVCVARENGAILWIQEEPAVQPEDPYRGMGVPEHGYATNTPVCDGKRVFAFLGKSGVLAFDLEGNKLWQTSVGTESGNRAWGTAASLILFEDLVIVNASEESQSIRALKADTGEEVWKATGAALELAYGTPILAKVDQDRTDLLIAVPGEIWGVNPRTGKLTWYVETTLTGNLSPSLILDGDIVIAFGGYRSSGSVAVRLGGKGNVTSTHTVWTSRNSSYVSTPVLVEGKLYWLDDRGTYYVSSAKTGELVTRSRVTEITNRDRPVYASPIAISNQIYLQTRYDGLFVVAPGSELKILAHNRFESDTSMFNATPAVDRGEMFLRSDAKLYCVRATNP